MKLITKLAIVATLMSMAIGALAQGRRMMAFTPSETSLLGQKDVQTDLKLSDDQIKKITDLQAKEREERQSIMQNAQASGNPPDPDAFKKLSDTYKSQYSAVLTPDQNKRLHEIFIQWRKNQAILDPDVQSALGISADQKAKIDDLQSKYNQANMDLFQKVRDGEISREDMQTTRQKNSDTFNDDLGKILTADQASKLKDMGGAPFTGKIQMGGGRRGGGGGR